MKVKQLFFLLLLASSLFFSCEKDTCGNRHGNYSSGVFVVNEGQFGSTGTITWYDPASGETVQDVYGAENCGAPLGEFVQSLNFHNGNGYMVVNGANKVVIVDARTFQYRGVIEGFELPRFFMPVSAQYAYVSQWGSDGLSGSLAKVDLQSKKIVQVIPVGKGPEKMVVAENRLLVANSGGYGEDATIVEIDLSTDNILNTYPTTGKNPSSLVLEDPAVANALYLCKGYFLDTNIEGNLNLMSGGTNSGISVAPYSDDLVRDDSGATFFTSNTSIYQVFGSGGHYTVSEVFAQYAYGLGLDSVNDLLYCADAKDFNSAGEVVIRKFDGTVVASFTAGIIPGEVVVVP